MEIELTLEELDAIGSALCERSTALHIAIGKCQQTPELPNLRARFEAELAIVRPLRDRIVFAWDDLRKAQWALAAMFSRMALEYWRAHPLPDAETQAVVLWGLQCELENAARRLENAS